MESKLLIALASAALEDVVSNKLSETRGVGIRKQCSSARLHIHILECSFESETDVAVMAAPMTISAVDVNQEFLIS